MWKINISYFDFFGIGVSFGVNPDGRAFFDLKVGIGFGTGFSYTPDGKSPNYREDGCYGSGGGGYARAGANLGPLSLDYGGSGGASSGANSIGSSIYNSQQGGLNFGRSLGIGGSISAGAEGIVVW